MDTNTIDYGHLEHLAETDDAAYLAALTTEQLHFRIRVARSCGWTWDADRFATELARRT